MEHTHTITVYSYGSGETGCLYDNGPHVAATLADAVEDLASTFELGAKRKATLKRNMHLALNPRRDGADYCEVTPMEVGVTWCEELRKWEVYPSIHLDLPQSATAAELAEAYSQWCADHE